MVDGKLKVKTHVDIKENCTNHPSKNPGLDFGGWACVCIGVGMDMVAAWGG